MDMLYGWLGGAGIAVILMAGIKFIPKMLGKLVTNKVSELMNKKMEDPVGSKLFKEWVLASVKLAEHVIPDRGQGKARYAMVAGMVCKYLPFMASQEARLAELIEAAVAQMDDELKKVGAPPPPPAA